MTRRAANKKWLHKSPRLIALFVLIIGVAVAALLIFTKPAPEKQSGKREGAVVETTTVQKQSHTVTIHGQGSVRAVREITVLPQVAGEVVSVNPNLVPGALVQRGELLFRINPADYQVALRQQQAQLQEAQANLELELGQREVAEQEWALFADELKEEQRNRALALREPQLQQARAAVASAQAAVAKAELDLSRTEVRAPFDGVIAEESVDLGQNLSAQSQALRLIGSDRLRIETSIPVSRLPYITIDPLRGSSADIIFDLGHARARHQGRVVQLLPELADNSRMARVLVEIQQPFAHNSTISSRASSKNSGTQQDGELAARSAGLDPAQAPLLINSYVSVEIRGEETLQAVQLPREYLRENNSVWLMENQRLVIREVKVAWEQPDTVLIDEGLSNGDHVITSSIASPIEGLRLRHAENQSGERQQAVSTKPEAARDANRHESHADDNTQAATSNGRNNNNESDTAASGGASRNSAL